MKTKAELLNELNRWATAVDEDSMGPRDAFGKGYDSARDLVSFTLSAILALPNDTVTWHCFHCAETFTDKALAAEHFGKSEQQNPACQIDIGEYREMEARMIRYNEEDADCHRAMRQMENKHQIYLRRSEDDGYAKALKDTKYALPDDTVIVPSDADGARYRWLAHHASVVTKGRSQYLEIPVPFGHDGMNISYYIDAAFAAHLESLK